jgi:HK97 family phage prohead protease
MRPEIKLKTLQTNNYFTDTIEDSDSMVTRKSFSLSVLRISPDDERKFVSRMTSIEEDRDGEIVVPEGIDIGDYEKNPVLCWQHMYSTPPIGKCTAIKRDKEGLIGIFQLSESDSGREAFQLVKEGSLSTVSIGFIRKSIVKRGTAAFTNTIKELGLKISDTLKQITTSCSLVETSLVTIPSNRQALILACSQKGFKATLKNMNVEGPKDTELPSSECKDITSQSSEQLPKEQPVPPKEEPKEIPKVEPEHKPYCNVIREGGYILIDSDKTASKSLSKGKLVFR